MPTKSKVKSSKAESNDDKVRAEGANRVVIRNLDDNGFKKVLDELREHFDTKYNNKALQLAASDYIPSVERSKASQEKLESKIAKLESDLDKMHKYTSKLLSNWERYCQGIALKEQSFEEMEMLSSEGIPVDIPNNNKLDFYRSLMKEG